MNRMLSVLMLLLLILSSAEASAANLIDATHGAGSGSFENSTGSFAETGPDFMRLADGSTFISGWEVTRETIDYLRSPGHNASEGTYSVDLSGNTLAIGSISTLIPTTVGQEYSISFDSYGGAVPQSNSAFVSAGTLVDQSFAPLSVSDVSSAAFESFVFNFFATAVETELSFTVQSSDGFGPVVDNVSVTLVPEPAAIFLVCVCGISALFRRR